MFWPSWVRTATSDICPATAGPGAGLASDGAERGTTVVLGGTVSVRDGADGSDAAGEGRGVLVSVCQGARCCCARAWGAAMAAPLDSAAAAIKCAIGL